MNNAESYDVAIAGGGLAGLSCAILLAKNNFRVALFEKEIYPFHKVCGEYISMESYDFLASLGLSLDEMNLPMISQLTLSSPSGNYLTQQMPLGGFGISRYTIDQELASIVRQQHADLYDGTKVNDIIYEQDKLKIITDKQNVEATVVCGAFGKRSNIDVKWKRKFIQQKPNALNNFIAVKYHAMLEHPRNNISLHNFRSGYCGISPVEKGNTCICYLTSSNLLKNNGNSIRQIEQQVLSGNPFLKKAFEKAEMLYEKPLAISQISFDKKEQVENHVLLLGDSAGLIAPLCGNGMSMALHSSRIAASLITRFLRKNIDREQMEKMYVLQWKEAFSKRLKAGRMIQSLFGREWVTNAMVGMLGHFPSMVNRIIRQTHGRSEI